MIRRLLSVVWIGLATVTLVVAVVSHVSPVLGYRVVIVAGTSMSPTIPLGSLLIEHAPGADGPVTGEVVTMEMPNGATITHRVLRVAEVDGARWVETQGDANAEPDPTLVPATAVSGVVALHLPFAGFVLAFLGRPTGAISILSALLALLFTIWLIEDGPRELAARDVVADAPAS